MATVRKKKEGSSSSGVILLGKYEQGKVLGQGTFAKVYHAKNVDTGDSVAIKVLDKEKMIKGGFMSHIKREISILRRVRHPNIVKLLEVMATKSKILLVMEYIRGGQLLKKLAKGRLKEDVARKYFQQLISAVGFCHARGVYHRDLKPENLLLDEKGDLKVSDFGLSAVSDQIQKDGLFHTFCGTPAYVAPEVLTRKGYDGAKVDVWSCGVILFVLMAGYLPFHDPNLMTMYRKIYKGQFRCPRWFSPDLVKLLLRLLDTNPETRITIPQLMENNWFKKHNNVIGSEKSGPSSSDLASLPRPASLNAFDLISFSPGFDLSGLLEEDDNEKGDSRFISGAPVSLIISKLEEIAKVVNFTVRIKDCRVSLEGSTEGAKGPLTLQAQVFELTPSLSMVEIIKQGGDKGDYEQFYHTQLSPGLDNIAITKTHTCSSFDFAGVSSSLLSDTE